MALTRQLFNQDKMIDDWESYKMALTCYNKQTQKAKWSAWREYCLWTEDLSWPVKSTNRVGSTELPHG